MVIGSRCRGRHYCVRAEGAFRSRHLFAHRTRPLDTRASHGVGHRSPVTNLPGSDLDRLRMAVTSNLCRCSFSRRLDCSGRTGHWRRHDLLRPADTGSLARVAADSGANRCDGPADISWAAYPGATAYLGAAAACSLGCRADSLSRRETRAPLFGCCRSWCCGPICTAALLSALRSSDRFFSTHCGMRSRVSANAPSEDG